MKPTDFLLTERNNSVSISVKCGCGATLTCPEKLAGMRMRCGWCKREIAIPEASGAARHSDVRLSPRSGSADAACSPSRAVTGDGGLSGGTDSTDLVCSAAPSIAPGYVTCPGCHHPVPPGPLNHCPYCGEDLNAKPEQAERHKSRRAPQWRDVTRGLDLIGGGGRILAATMLCCSGVFLALAVMPALALGYHGLVLVMLAEGLAVTGGFWFKCVCDDELLVRAYGVGLAVPVVLVISAVAAPSVAVIGTILAVVAVVAAALVALVRMLVGSCRCLSLPLQAGGRHYLELAIGSAIAAPVVPMVVLLVATAINGEPARSSPSPWLVASLAAIPNALAAGAMLLFLNFLHGVSSFFDDEPTTEYIDGCATWFTAWAAAYVVVSAATAGLAAAHDNWVVLGFSGMTACWLLGTLWLLRFMATVSAVSDGIGRVR